MCWICLLFYICYITKYRNDNREKEEHIILFHYKKGEIEVPSYERMYELVRMHMNEINTSYSLFNSSRYQKKIGKINIDRTLLLILLIIGAK